MPVTEKLNVASAEMVALNTSALKPSGIQVTVSPKVTQKDLHSVIDAISKMHGCLGCGLGGLDLRIRPQDTKLIDAVSHIDAVRDISFIR